MQSDMMPPVSLTLLSTLPEDPDCAKLVARVWQPDVQGPVVVALRNGTIDLPAARSYSSARFSRRRRLAARQGSV